MILQFFYSMNEVSASLRNRVCSTQVPARTEIMHGGATDVFFQQLAGMSPYNIFSVGATLNPTKNTHTSR